MTLNEIMSFPVVTVCMDASVRTAAQRMQRADVGMLVVTDGAGRARGVITDRDIAVRVVAAGLDAAATPAGRAMTPEVACCLGCATVEEGVRLMEDEGVRRLVVVDHEERAVGVVSALNLACYWDESRAGEMLRTVCEGAAEQPRACLV